MNNQFILTMSENGKDSLIATFKAVPDDKLTWKPLDSGRCALDLFSEAAQISAMMARFAETKGEAKPNAELFGQMRAERADWTKERALEEMDANFELFRTAVTSLSDEELMSPVIMPIRGGMTLPLAGWIMMAYRTYVARFAQINYIQTLYGDFEPHN